MNMEYAGGVMKADPVGSGCGNHVQPEVPKIIKLFHLKLQIKIAA